MAEVEDDDLAPQIEAAATRAVQLCRERYGEVLDYSLASLPTVDRLLADGAGFLADLTQQQYLELLDNVASYLLELARREFGGYYMWHHGQDQAVLVTGEPNCRVALLTREQVRMRLEGEEGEPIQTWYAEFAERARTALPGDSVLYA